MNGVLLDRPCPRPRLPSKFSREGVVSYRFTLDKDGTTVISLAFQQHRQVTRKEGAEHIRRLLTSIAYYIPEDVLEGSKVPPSRFVSHKIRRLCNKHPRVFRESLASVHKVRVLVNDKRYYRGLLIKMGILKPDSGIIDTTQAVSSQQLIWIAKAIKHQERLARLLVSWRSKSRPIGPTSPTGVRYRGREIMLARCIVDLKSHSFVCVDPSNCTYPEDAFTSHSGGWAYAIPYCMNGVGAQAFNQNPGREYPVIFVEQSEGRYLVGRGIIRQPEIICVDDHPRVGEVHRMGGVFKAVGIAVIAAIWPDSSIMVGGDSHRGPISAAVCANSNPSVTFKPGRSDAGERNSRLLVAALTAPSPQLVAL